MSKPCNFGLIRIYKPRYGSLLSAAASRELQNWYCFCCYKLGPSASFKMESLETMAFKSFYRDITSSLRLLNYQSLMSQSSLFLLYPQLTSKQIVDFIRDRLDQRLSNTTMNNQVRKKLVKYFSGHSTESTGKDSCHSCQMQEPFLFLNCVLDQYFEDLKLNIPINVKVKDESTDLIEIIAKRSPFLSSLTFNLSIQLARIWELLLLHLSRDSITLQILPSLILQMVSIASHFWRILDHHTLNSLISALKQSLFSKWITSWLLLLAKK